MIRRMILKKEVNINEKMKILQNYSKLKSVSSG